MMTLTQNEADIQNNPTATKKVELVVKNLPKKNVQVQMEFTKHLKK
jgi:hypothetical protein